MAILLLLMLGVILVMAHIIRDSQKIQKLMYKDVEIDIWNLNHLLPWLPAGRCCHGE